MIESNEPRDGDFVRYVDELMRRSPGAPLPQAPGPGEVVPAARGERESLLQTLRDVLTNRAGAPPRTGTPPPAGSGPDSARLPAPERAQAPATARSPAPMQPRTVPSSARTRAGGASAESAMVARVLARIASIASFAGVVLLAMSFADEPPVPIDPIVGIALLAGAAVVRRIARGLA